VFRETILMITIQESNIILAKTYEYRMPTEKAEREALEHQQTGQGAGRAGTASMKSRFLGLVVVPGRHIIKLEVEEKKSWELPLRPT
jgi:N-alpha-acetyltransferase 38, NatC auxiliary subunit